MYMNFGTDTEQIVELASKLNVKAGEIEKVIASIYSRIEGLKGNGWSGSSYESFLGACNSYKGSLNKLPGVIKDFANFFSGTVNKNATTLHDNVKTDFSNIENV